MDTFGLYILKSAIILAIFFSIYHFLLKNETFFRFNRLFLLTGLLACVLFPFFTLLYPQYITPVTPEEAMPITLPVTNALTVHEAGETLSSLTLVNGLKTAFFILYILGTAIFLSSRLYGLKKLLATIRKQGYTTHNGYHIINNGTDTSPFSFFRFIFLSARICRTEEKERILKHEQAHIDERHWIDLLLIETVTLFQWFNPLVWFYAHAIRQNHEYLADRAVLQVYSKISYQQTLINQWLKGPVFPAINTFCYSNPLKRFNMMKKNLSNPFKQGFALLVLPALAAFFWSFAEPEYITLPGTGTPLPPTGEEMIPTEDDMQKHPEDNPEGGRANVSLELIKNALKQQKATAKNQSDISPTPTRKTSKSAKTTKLAETGKTVTDTLPKIFTHLHAPSKPILEPLVIVDGEAIEGTIESVDQSTIHSMRILRDSCFIKKYGPRAGDGVLLIITKKNRAALLEKEGVDITGIVTDEAGNPLPDVTLITYDEVSATTDANGTFKLHALPTVWLYASGKGYLPGAFTLDNPKTGNTIRMKKLIPGMEINYHSLPGNFFAEEIRKINFFLSITLSKHINIKRDGKGEIALDYTIDENGNFSDPDLQLLTGTEELKQKVAALLKDVPQVTPPTIQGVPVKLRFTHNVFHIPWTDGRFVPTKVTPEFTH